MEEKTEYPYYLKKQEDGVLAKIINETTYAQIIIYQDRQGSVRFLEQRMLWDATPIELIFTSYEESSEAEYIEAITAYREYVMSWTGKVLKLEQIDNN